MNPPVDTPEITGRSATHDLVDLGMEAVDRFVARVLRQAHQTAIAVGAPAEARAILGVAQAFADELARAEAGFDRLAFLAAVTEDPS